MSNILYLGSQSSARHILLHQAAIPFLVIPITVVEEEAEVTGTVEQQVEALAAYKHSGIDVAAVVAQHKPSYDKPLFFLTADTLIAGRDNGRLYGKPRDRAHAAEMVREIAQQDVDVVTGMCLSVYRYDQSTKEWKQHAYETWHAGAICRFAVDDDMVEEYLDNCPAAMLACGATVIEEIGIRYFATINGSYTGTLGIDLYSLNKQLRNHGFWSSPSKTHDL